MSLHALIIEPQNPGQHCGGARDLLLLVHGRSVRRVRFKIVCDTLADERQQRQQVIALAVLIEFSAQRLHEPRALCCVTPRVESCEGRKKEVHG